MKQALVALSGFAWLQLTAAACCRTNNCLQAVASAIGGIQDCSSQLVVTVTPTASTISETVTVLPTEHNTFVDTLVFTETVTITAATETLLYTVSSTVTDSTYTDVSTVTQTVVVTETALQTATTTSAIRVYPAKRGETLVASGSSIPAYASAYCPSFQKYRAACKCVGVVATTVTAEAPSATTVTVSETANAVTVSVSVTVSSTETVYVSLTATTSATDVDTVLVTATVLATETTTASSVVTVTETTTTTIVPAAPTCIPPSEVAPFMVQATESGTTPLLMWTGLESNNFQGSLNWNRGAAPSPPPNIQNKYIWTLDSDSNLVLAYTIPPYTYKIGVYAVVNTDNTLRPRLDQVSSITSRIANGANHVRVRGCINSATGELTLEAAGRKNILLCGAQLWMSYTNGEDIKQGAPCVRMYPKVLAPV